MRKSWRSIGLLVISYWLLAAPVQALPEIKPTFPRLANYFLHWTISESEARELARFDLVILDAEVQERSRAALKLIRALNPRVILLAYVPASEVRRDAVSLAEIAPLRYKLGASIPEEWYLKNAAGSRMSFWPGTWIVDVTGPSPQPSPAGRGGFNTSPSPNPSHQGRGISFNFLPLDGGGQEGVTRWNEYLPQFVAREILSTGFWDGVFYDNARDDIVHFARGVPDLNRDGLADDEKEARRVWQQGVRQIYRRTVELVPDKFVFENDGPIYAPEVHGVLLESFPRKGWARHREELQRVRRDARDPAVAILNSNTFNTGRRDDYRAVRYGFTAALLHDAFYSFDFGDQDHGQTWFYDEYGAFLGEPVGEGKEGKEGKEGGRGVWRRSFEKGIVLVNPEAAAREVQFPIEVEKLRGVQDPTTNDGAIARELVVGAQDGLIVLRPLKIIPGAPFENGVFARVFNAQGEVVRAGFFALDRQERSGVILTFVDVDGDGRVEKIKRVEKSKMEIGLRRLDLRLAGDPISLAFGDVTGDGVKEIVVGAEGQVRIFRIDGTLLVLPFFPFGSQYRGGAHVAVGDLNGDGFSEIVVGAGPGGGPQVRIFSGQGRLLSGGFFAYDPRFRGGVRVAVGDVDHDGVAEIVTGPGVGGGPQVRIFDGKGRARGPGFFAFDRASRAGATPIVADVDGDGRNEIVAVTKEIL